MIIKINKQINVWQLGKELNAAGVRIMKENANDVVDGYMITNKDKIIIKGKINEAKAQEIVNNHVADENIIQPPANIETPQEIFAKASLVEKVNILAKYKGLI